ncbi:titin homolog isoform X1 [Malaya genurostris]|uniref:titin homolog isoform X1 n=1 Tax=Malaya genurostris TaxID=325434 RepID=UPI0026F3BA03|nr:titin homolog isoform X1 [Malaya genurostris]XP_058455359.1 titin homolog isoform X1 [Malaya genurostris]XP_058455360.1 titin homolog isoform X1 [Malaya genurostris]XP_058455361.1 titin homolog isoform X1 [Malaya genurostris]XP_058455362.1 titin homolog isoform X1 [Malaya genurostris]
MATREKKPRSVNSDSPTPSLGGGSDSAPSTPTSKGKGSRVSLSRQKSKQSQNANEDSVQSTDDISDMPAIEATSSSIGRPSSSSSSSRTTRATKDESAEQANNSKEKEKDESKDSKDSKASSNRKTAEKKKKSIIGKGATVKTTVTALKKTTLMKRKTRPIVGKPVLGKKVIARKQINSKGKKEVTVTVKEEDSKNTNLRNGKPRATDSPVGKRKSVTPKDKSPKDATSDSVTVKVERRRSDSVSKCSDVTDASLLDTSSCKDEDDKKDETSLLELKRELMEEHETKTKILDKMAEAFNERKTPTVPLSKDDKKVRRSARQRKSTTRDKDDFVTPKLKAPVDIKAEPMDSEEPVAAPLCIDTETAMKETPSGELEKDSSLSPELVSEGVSEISVKEFYSEPAFLENNLGIEKDPKLGEIVQVQEKIKLDKESDSVVTANGSTSVMQEALPVVIKKEKVEPNESREDDRESVLLNSEQMEVGKLKEIIGIVETSELPPIVVIPKYECSGNESPASDGSNDVMATVSSKVESILKKIDSRSDSDGERPNKQNTQKAKVTGKETKPKSRNLKDKCKEDEKVKEEKLRQEKIRVEEKVREEKLRAELLIHEKQKKIHEDIIPQDDKVKKDQDVMNSSSVTPERIGKQVSPNHDDEVVSVVEKVLPSTTITTLSLTSADSHLVLSVTSTDPIDIVENTKIEPSIVTNTITLENLPAITLLKKESNQAKNDNVIENVQLKAELEILPIKEVVVAKGENFMTKDPELSLHIVPKSGETEATISEKSFTIEECTSPNSVIKIETDVKKDSANSAIFKETPAEIQEVKASDAVENREPIERVPQMNHAKTVEISSLSVTEDVLPVIDSNNPETSSVVGDETDDITKQKESHFKHLGLLTLQAASAEKQRRKELVLQKPTGGSGSGYSSSSSSGGKSSGKPCRNSESTGTLKTVIKLNRGEKRRARLPLKMTLQKGKGKGTEKDANGAGGNGETAFYIIQNENDHQNQSMPDAAGASQQARKAHSRSHTTDAVTLTEVVAETATKEVVQKALVIPEKASSFNVHPERLCQDQCFYCGGKFGLYDTPCHIAAMKSTERQQKILASEVKIKIDSCLCDACFRHVDRKTNCPSYRKKTEAKSLTSLAKMQSNTDSSHEDKQSHEDMVRSPTSITRESTETDTKDESAQSATIEDLEIVEERVHGSCYVQNCGANASHTIRRKWLLKMKKTISKIFEINLEQANVTSNLIPICDSHYELISHLMICAMCKRRLPKNHIYYIVNEIPQLERLIQEQGIAMKLGNSTLVVCKLCRYYANLLLKPPDAKSQKAQFIKNYNRRMLQFCEREKEQDQQEPSNAVAEPIRIISNPDIVISDGEEESTAILSMSDSVSLQRRRRHSQKSTEISIIDSNCSQMAELEEVTITPAPKLTTVPSVGVDSSIILDTTDASNEQAVASAEKRRKDDTLDMTKALKANPNISMRELFPGEEELAIHINIPFNTASTRTPEGWAKVTTTLQYDDATRALWEDLQKPYGNQSSFLRHLVLLEKYYRNGDLILSPQAKNNAATYSEAVQNRLRAFDNIPTPPPVTAIDKTTILQQLGNAPITIIPASNSRTKSSTEPVSLLKSNNPHLVVSGEPSATSLKRKLSVDSKSKAVIGKPDAAQGNKIIKLDETIVLPGSKTPSLVPPELISINAKQNVTITSIPSTKTQTLTLQSQPVQQQSLLQPQQSLLQPQTSNKKSPGTSGAREIIKLPDQLTEAERRETSKPWRPTLIPITPGSSEAIKAGPLYQTADGRRLPKLVQVMSGGKPYHISINDYNRMCILRREKLLQQQLLQQQIHQHQKRMQQQSPPNPTKAPKSSETTIGSAKMVQIPNQILEQNSLIPINNTGNNGSGNTKSNGPNSELQQLIRTRKPNSNSNLMPTAVSSAAATAFFKNTLSMNAASKALSLPNSTSLFSMSLQNQQQQHPPNASSPTTPSQLDQLIKSNNQFLSSFVSQSQLSAMVAQAAAAAAANSGNPMLSAGTSGGSILMDNSAAQLLSKIPKSLTVIPQQKQRSLSRVSSNEDQSSA